MDETYECAFALNISHMNEDSESDARHILAEQLERIAAGLRDGFRTEGKIMHPNGHAIGSFALMQTNLPEN